MSRILAIAGLIILTIGIGITSCIRPEIFGDSNSFLKNFVNHELLAVLGVIVTITLASAASLHLELNRLENDTGEEFLEARSATKAYAYLLITLFGAALALVIAKPVVAETESVKSLFNGAAILVIVLNMLALIDLTSAVFAIPPDRRLKK